MRPDRCAGKLAFTERANAETTSNRLNAELGRRTRVYRCPRGHWHLTSKKARTP